MKRNTEKNRERLASEAVEQMDLKTMASILREQLEYEYDGLSSKEFNDIWVQVFGED